MKKTLINYTKNGPFDELYTPVEAIEPLLSHIPSGVRKIWCPFDKKESKIVQVLQREAYSVAFSHIDDGQDFFKYEPTDFDMIISNPPFSVKNKVIERCYSFGKPFALLLPITALEGSFRGDLYNSNGMGVLVLDKRIDFNGKGKCWFNTSWFIHSDEMDGKLRFSKIK